MLRAGPAPQQALKRPSAPARAAGGLNGRKQHLPSGRLGGKPAPGARRGLPQARAISGDRLKTDVEKLIESIAAEPENQQWMDDEAPSLVNQPQMEEQLKQLQSEVRKLGCLIQWGFRCRCRRTIKPRNPRWLNCRASGCSAQQGD